MRRWTAVLGPGLWLMLMVARAVAQDSGAPLATLHPAVLAAEQQRIEAVGRALPATVSIFIPGGGGGGSGVLISPDGYALSNFHVTSPAGSYMRCGLSDGRIYDAVIIGVDPVGDLALIRLLGRDDFPYAELGDSRTAQPGDHSMVIGNPFLLSTNLQPTVTWGILSGVGRYQYPAGTLLEYADCLQTDASINPGNSGGPLFDATGRLIGIVGRASFEKRGRVNVGVGYAISLNQALQFLGDLHSGRVLDHATLGATVATDPNGGARITNILSSSDAYRRGLRHGNTIVEIDGRSVNSANDVQNVLATLPPQWRVSVSYLDRGERKTTLVRLANLHLADELLEKMAASLPPPPPIPDAPPADGEPGKETPPADGPAPGDAPAGSHPPASGDGDIPPAVQALLEERHGYANYYPNRQHQARLTGALENQFPHKPADAAASWQIVAKTADASAVPVQIVVAPGRYELTVGGRVTVASSSRELYDGITNADPAGILAALHVWQSLLARGASGFGDCSYRGQVPLLGQRPLRDCLIGTSEELEASWLFHPETGQLEAIEVIADREDDPAELLIGWGDDRAAAPQRLELRYGTRPVLSLDVVQWTVSTEQEPTR